MLMGYLFICYWLLPDQPIRSSWMYCGWFLNDLLWRKIKNHPAKRVTFARLLLTLRRFRCAGARRPHCSHWNQAVLGLPDANHHEAALHRRWEAVFWQRSRVRSVSVAPRLQIRFAKLPLRVQNFLGATSGPMPRWPSFADPLIHFSVPETLTQLAKEQNWPALPRPPSMPTPSPKHDAPLAAPATRSESACSPRSVQTPIHAGYQTGAPGAAAQIRSAPPGGAD